MFASGGQDGSTREAHLDFLMPWWFGTSVYVTYLSREEGKPRRQLSDSDGMLRPDAIINVVQGEAPILDTRD
ncbi:hypothetical protein ASPCADRAFT_10828 [Aspergillus carbonarius ITEM 5010]|uniref:Uncharacterized protein n=1 Tax=Aspergillus carbonarius (strain ITEM 5010) TaxID=602072 RepID=A0A1R3R701_ASPC5|nr:hypothetical protein ASPCADRAFT_10828 [Aspergillus carbonarius ITEM 5010]